MHVDYSSTDVIQQSQNVAFAQIGKGLVHIPLHILFSVEHRGELPEPPRRLQPVLDAIDAQHSKTLSRIKELITMNENINADLEATGFSTQISYLTGLVTEIHEACIQQACFKVGVKEMHWKGSISIEHEAAAHKLLKLPAVQELLGSQYDEDYAMTLEEERGPICLFRKGENCFSGNASLGSHETGSGYLNLDEGTARRYFEIYLDRIHELHPFLDKQEVSIQLDDFIKSYCTRSLVEHLNVPQQKQLLQVGTTVENARILMLLALGAICETGPTLSDVDTEEELDYRQQYIPKICKLPSPSHPTHSNSNKYKAFPGLKLYGHATTILGYFQGGAELCHVQTCLLAALYSGQLAHPFQSHSWIHQAARECQILVRQSRYQRMEEGRKKDMYSFAYWTALQLECDILAELDIPASGLLQIDSRIPTPKGIFTLASPADDRMMRIHSTQIYLCKLLNNIFAELYKVGGQ
ncbi:uncharacterized protein N7483_002515 [Penicillium malachiteum]|uniref:uncharacterized protein n=1 Tax=Penicillium malachiteum TaxID=1324776 RepID=UPI002548605F|nr:uncharacterized protein N7483_002515 [Penicillium malachiteum]KAJ5737390.1 hypothetical protein N7483_002515 [Penicillium malachiteum]